MKTYLKLSISRQKYIHRDPGEEKSLVRTGEEPERESGHAGSEISRNVSSVFNEMACLLIERALQKSVPFEIQPLVMQFSGTILDIEPFKPAGIAGFEKYQQDGIKITFRKGLEIYNAVFGVAQEDDRTYRMKGEISQASTGLPIFKETFSGLGAEQIYKKIINIARSQLIDSAVEPSPEEPLEMNSNNIIVEDRSEKVPSAVLFNDKHCKKIVEFLLENSRTGSLKGSEAFVLLSDQNYCPFRNRGFEQFSHSGLELVVKRGLRIFHILAGARKTENGTWDMNMEMRDENGHIVAQDHAFGVDDETALHQVAIFALYEGLRDDKDN